MYPFQHGHCRAYDRHGITEKSINIIRENDCMSNVIDINIFKIC